ncbi:group II intron maturase-specific domain-containing protein [Dactylosporangium sp. NPDC051541]|uniref:group II intron maturase-specific domain-containing protein n=1 Tax=Dactylosporangium sp. NPDC051541 TaxID=3363977 RepID=UPI0037BCFE94
MGEIAKKINPIVRGWIRYYGAFYRPRCVLSSRASTPTWCAGSARNTNGCGPTRRRWRPGNASPASTPDSSPTGHGSTHPGRQDDKSWVTGDCHAQLCESREVRLRPGYST